MNPKKFKIQKTLKEEGEGGDDRISALPDATLCHILSFLPTKFAVATTVLSTRWNQLFASLPDLDFDDELLLHPQHGNVDTTKSFSSFVNRVLSLPNSHDINKFRLTCGSKFGSFINDWIHAALRRNVKHLDILIRPRSSGFGRPSDSGVITLPREVFSCRTLVTFKLKGEITLKYEKKSFRGKKKDDTFDVFCLPNLKVLHVILDELPKDESVIQRVISGCCHVLEELVLSGTCAYFSKYLRKAPTSVVLPHLKVLHLIRGAFTSGVSLERAFSALPALEELKLSHCHLEDVDVLNISIPSLKRLTISDCEGKYLILLSAPILEYFHHSDSRARWYLVKDLKSLAKAHLHIGAEEPWDNNEVYDDRDDHITSLQDDISGHDDHVTLLVNDISGVKFLHLSDKTLKRIECSRHKLATFQQLTHLELGDTFTSGWKLLPDLLECSPNLEVLAFVKEVSSEDEDEDEPCDEFCEFVFHLPENVPICLSQHLKEIKIVKIFSGTEEEVKLLEYLLRYGQVLKRMTIVTEYSGEWAADIQEGLLMFPRCSKTCEIVFT